MNKTWGLEFSLGIEELTEFVLNVECGCMYCLCRVPYSFEYNSFVPARKGKRLEKYLGDLRRDLRPLFIRVRSPSVPQTLIRGVSGSAAASRTGSASGVCVPVFAGLVCG